MNRCIKCVSILIILMAFAAVASAAPPDITTPTSSPISVSDTEGTSRDFSIVVNQTVDVKWYINGSELSSEGGSCNANTICTYSNSSAAVGYWNVSAVATNSNGTDMQTWWWTVTGTSSGSGSPSITTPTSSPISVSDTEGTSRDFSIVVNQTVDVKWYINGSELSSEGGSCNANTICTYSNSSAAVGYWNVSAVATNSNGTDMQTWWWTVTGTSSGSGSPSITTPTSSPISVSDTEGTSRDFSIVVNQTVDVKWYINGSELSSEGGSCNANTVCTYSNSSAAVGYWNVSAVATNSNGTDMQTWWWTVTASGHSTGFRIWDADREPPMDLNYTWDARSFTGFYYDLDDDTSTETLTVQLDNYDDRTIDEDKLKYITTAADIDFEYDDWGKYKVIGFMAEKYFAGYEKDKTDITTEDISLISKDMLSKVLIDEDEKHMISTGASLELKEGYELKVIQLDVDGNQAQVELLKNGKSVDTDIVRSPDNYIYEKDLGKLDDVPLVAVRITSVFAGTESDMLVIEGIFQVSDDTIPIDTGDEYDEMEIKSSSRYTIEMRNMDDIDLEADETVDIMGNLKFIVADSDTLRFALYEDITSEPGTHDIRGTVYNTTEKPTWDHMNFEGFYYDIDDDLGTEELRVESSGNTIDEDNLVYTTTPNLVRFELDDWGSYEVIGFMAEPYFAGYDKDETDDEITNDDISLISKDMLSKVLIDVDDKRMISTGASLQLEEGYELKVIQLDVDGNQAQVELLKNGKSVDTDIVRSPDTYVYEKDLGKLDDVPIVAISISSVFAGTESDMLVIEGAFQISDDPISVDTGDEYGEMEITSATSSKIEMKNRENVIDLDGDETIMITDNIGFKVSEDEERYYLFVRRTIGSIAALKIELPESLIVDEEIVITVTADGSPVEGVQVQFAGENLGLTDSDGKVRIRSEEAGTFTIVASKENYDSVSEEIRILTETEAEKDPLKIEMPDTAEPGEDVVIMVSYKGDAIDNASISWDGDDIGETDETGSLTYTAEDEGTYTVTANKDGYLEGKEEIEVAYPSAEFELTDLTFPENVSVNKEFTVSVDVTNTGDADGTYLAELKVNDSVVDSQNVTLDAGDTEKIEFTTRIVEAGTTTIGIGTESGEITVTKSKSNTTLIAIVLIVLALLGAIGYLLISSAPEGGWTVGRLSDAIKDKFQRGGTEL